MLAYFELNASYMDFRAYYYGVAAIAHGEQLYGPALAWREHGYTQFLPGQSPPTQNGAYVYPPSAALAFLALTVLPFRAAAHVWLAVIFASFLGAVYVLGGLLFAIDGRTRIALTLAAGAIGVLFHASRAQLELGQADFVMLLLVTLAFAAHARRRDAPAGLWLGLAAAVKPTLALLMLWFLWKRSYRAALAFCVLSGVLILTPVLLFGVNIVLDFAAVAQYFSGPVFAVTPINQSPYGLLLRLFSANPFTVPVLESAHVVDIARGAIVAIVILMLLRTVSRSRALSATHLALEYGLVIAATLLVGPLSEDIHYVYLLIPFAAVAAALVERWQPPSRRAVICASVLVATYACLSSPGMVDVLFAFDMRVTGPIHAPQVLLTGAMAYGLAAVTALVVMTLRWYRIRLER